MAGGLLSLKWNNHATTFLGLLENLHYKDNFSDATLACEGKIYPVHKFVLSVCSDYFKSIFENTPQWKQSVVVLKDISCSEVEALLSYMYIGEVNVVQDNLPGLLRAAECLRVKGLAVPDEKCNDPKKVSEPCSSVLSLSTSNVMKQTNSGAHSRNLREKRAHSTTPAHPSLSHLPPQKRPRLSNLARNPIEAVDASTSNEQQQFPPSISLNSNKSSKDTNIDEVSEAFHEGGCKKISRRSASTLNGTNNNLAREMKFEECIADDVVTVKPEPVDSSNQLPEAQDITQNWSNDGQHCALVAAGEPSSLAGPASSTATSTSICEQSPSAHSPATRNDDMAPIHDFEDVPALLPSPLASWEDQHRRDGERDHHLQAKEIRRSNPFAGPLIYTSASPATFAPEEPGHSFLGAFSNFQSPTRESRDRQAYYSPTRESRDRQAYYSPTRESRDRQAYYSPTREWRDRQAYYPEYGLEQRPTCAAVAQRSVGSSSFPTSYPIPIETVVSRTSSPLLDGRSRTLTRRWIPLNSTQEPNNLHRRPVENDCRQIQHSPVGSPTHDTLYFLSDGDPINLCISNSNVPTSSGCSIPETQEQLANRRDHDSCFVSGSNSTSYYSGRVEQIPCSSGASRQSPVTTLSTPVSEDSGSDSGRVHRSAKQKRRHRLSKEVYERMTPEQFQAHRREHTRHCSKQYREREKHKRESYNRELEEQVKINKELREKIVRLDRQRFLLEKYFESKSKIKSGP